MNWGWYLLRMAIFGVVLSGLFFSQRFWYRSLWRWAADWRSAQLRVVARVAYLVFLALIVTTTIQSFRMGHHRTWIPRGSIFSVLAGLWLTSAFFAFVGIKIIDSVDRLWSYLRKINSDRADRHRQTASTVEEQEASSIPMAPPQANVQSVADPSRRYLFKTASALAGSAPFLVAMYGFAAERLDYQVHRVEVPMANLPLSLDGMRILQLSDIHMSGYLKRNDLRRAIDMANDLGGDIAVVTGDFITGASDPLADCIAEISRLHAPLGIWGCNGNHEVYARAESAAQQLFAQRGMHLLRQENAQVAFRGAEFNLIGVDYEHERTSRGQRLRMLAHIAPLVRRDLPNILLSHNPNTFNRAAELGIELSLAGHTHGGQIQVEILDHRLSPARFMTDYVAGLYQRPLFAAAPNNRALPKYDDSGRILAHPQPSAALYVNRGLGTVGAPVRLGVPPELTLLTLRSA